MQFELQYVTDEELTLEVFRFGVVLSLSHVVVRLVRYERSCRSSVYAPWMRTDALWVWPDLHGQSTIPMPDLAAVDSTIRARIASLVDVANLSE